MPKLAVYNMQGQQVGDIELKDEVFGIEPNKSVLHDAVVMQTATWRLGTAAAKTRSEVSGGGKKPWRQKGTGRARAGSIRSPLWRKGGVVFPPIPRDYSYKLPKKVRRLALKSALSAKVIDGNVIVLDSLDFAAPKTKEMIAVLEALNLNNKVLVVTASENANVELSARNIAGVKPTDTKGINVYDLLYHDTLVITKEAVQQVEEVLANA